MALNLKDRFGQAYGSLKFRDFRLFYTALLVASLGSQLQSTANLWLVYELTGSPLHLGLTGLARGLPTLIFSLVGGIIADRVDRKKFLIVIQAASGLLSLTLAALTATGLIQLWHVYVITLIGSSLSAINTPSRTAIVPNLVPRPFLLNAIALNSTAWQISRLLGPALAGILIALFGLSTTYLLDGAAHLGTLFTLAAISVGAVKQPSRGSALESLVEGLSFIRQRSIILALLSMDLAAVFFGSYRALLPVFASRLGVGPEGLGLFLSAPAAGALVGATFILMLGNVRYKGLLVAAGILAYCASLAVLALSPWFLLSLGTTVMLGFFDSIQATPRNAIIQSITPDELRGRVSSFQRMLTNGGPALGQAQSGAVATLIGAPLTLMVGALICTVTILGILGKRRDLRAAEL